MKKIFLIFSMAFLGIQGYAQKTETDKEFIKLVDDFVTHYTSQDYKNYQSLSNQFGELMGVTSFNSYEHIFEDWIVQNIEETQFTNVDEAIDLYNKLRKSFNDEYDKMEELDIKKKNFAEKSDDESFENIFWIILEQQLLVEYIKQDS